MTPTTPIIAWSLAMCIVLSNAACAQDDSETVAPATMLAREILFVGESGDRVDAAAEELLSRDACPIPVMKRHTERTPVLERSLIRGMKTSKRSAEASGTFSLRSSGSDGLQADVTEGTSLFSRCVAQWNGAVRACGVFSKRGGEKFVDAPRSFCASYQSRSFQCVAGDFLVSFGEGLVMGKGTVTHGEGTDRVCGGGADVTQYCGSGGGPYLRGGLLGFSFCVDDNLLRCIAWGSGRFLTATVQPDGSVSGFEWNNILRTSADALRRDALRETTAGGRIEWIATGKFGIGCSGLVSMYDRAIAPASGLGFRGRKSTVVGADVSVLCEEWSFFLESACNGPGWSSVAGIVIKIAKETSVAIEARRFAEDFANPRAGAPGEHADASNEEGFLVAFSAHILDRFVVDGSIDMFRFPGRTVRNDLPGEGMRVGIRCVAKMPGGVSGILRLQTHAWTDVGVTALPGGTVGRVQVDGQRFVGTVLVLLDVSRRIAIRHMITTTQVGYGGMRPPVRGGALSLGMTFTCRQFSIVGRWGAFDADTFDAAVYDAEPDIGRAVTAPALFGRGTHGFASLSWNSEEGLQIQAVFSATLWTWRPTGVVPSLNSQGYRSYAAGIEAGFRF